MSSELRAQCQRFFAGHPEPAPSAEFARMARWCEHHGVSHDAYGLGILVNDFEVRLADLLGYEAGVFLLTGTLAQALALDLACRARGRTAVAMHETAHPVLHEGQAYQLLNRYDWVPVGEAQRPWTWADLQPVQIPLAAILYELPMRELGGQLPGWEQLEALKQAAGRRGVHRHLDGARLWEFQAYYQRDYAQICQGFDSAYVSFYKGIGALGGAMLLGDRAFVDEARIWQHRHGGRVYRASPYVVAAAMRFDERLQRMSSYFERTCQLYELLSGYPALRANPHRPQSNMLHIHLPITAECARAGRDQIARERGAWLFSSVAESAVPGHCYLEWYVGEHLLQMNDDDLRQGLEWLQKMASG